MKSFKKHYNEATYQGKKVPLNKKLPGDVKKSKVFVDLDGDGIETVGAQAANRLGISTQVPAKSSYATSGATRVKNVAGRTIVFKRSHAPILDNGSDNANAVLQILMHFGKASVDDDLIRRLAARIDDRDLKALKQAQSLMPGWMSDVVLKMGIFQHG